MDLRTMLGGLLVILATVISYPLIQDEITAGNYTGWEAGVFKLISFIFLISVVGGVAFGMYKNVKG